MPLDEKQLQTIRRYAVAIDKGDYYQLLRLPHGADLSQIKDAFRKESKAWHPDRYFRQVPDDVYRMVTQVYKRMVEAQQVLSDPASKAVYDKRISGPDRMKHLRYFKDQEELKQRKIKDEDICKNENARRYAKLAFTALNQKNLVAAWIIAVATILLLGVVRHATEAEFAFASAAIIPVFMITWSGGFRHGFAMAKP